MKAVITVVGHDSMGIIAKVSTVCAEVGANIEDISQTIMGEYFAMIMIADVSEADKPLAELAKECHEMGKKIGMTIYMQHEDIFNAMHNI